MSNKRTTILPGLIVTLAMLLVVAYMVAIPNTKREDDRGKRLDEQSQQQREERLKQQRNLTNPQ